MTSNDSHIPTMARNLRSHLADQASNAESFASEDSRTENGAAVGAIAYYQHGMHHARQLHDRALEEAVRYNGLSPEEIAEGLAEHGITTTAADLRAAYPQIKAMERQVQWMHQNAPAYIPLLHQVSRVVAVWPGLVPSEHYREAEQVHRLVACTLADIGWEGNPWELDMVKSSPGLVMIYAPHRHPWLSHLAVGVVTDGLARDAVDKLREMVSAYYQAGQEITPVPDDLDPIVGDPVSLLRDAVTNRRGTDVIPLHVATPVHAE